MELRLTAVDGAGGRSADLLVDVEPDAAVGSVAREIVRHLGGGTPGDAGEAPALFVNGYPLAPALPVADSPVRDGATVLVGAPGAGPRPEAQGTVEVRVVGGPDAGRVHRLGPGVAVLGSGPEAWVRPADSTLPSSACEIDVAVDGTVTLTPAFGSSVTMDGRQLEQPAIWRQRGVVAAGHSLFELREPTFPDAALKPSQDGTGLDYNRPPRIKPSAHKTQFQLPPKPKQSETRPLPWAVALAPMLAAVAMVVLLGSAIYLIMAVLTPVTLVANHFYDRRHGRTSHRRKRREYEQHKVSIEYQARKAMAEETAARRLACPDPAELYLVATGPGQRLWERRLEDDDYGRLRVGTGTLPSEVEVSDPNQQEHRRTEPRMLSDVPVSVPLRTHGILGVAGRGELPRAIGRWLVAQASVLHSPADLSICVLTDPSGSECWEWVRWLPHARGREGHGAVALLGTETESVARRISELLALLGARQENAGESRPGSDEVWRGPSVLVVLDGSRRLRALPGLTQLLREGPRFGIHLVCLDADRGLLPEECRALVEEDHFGLLQVSQFGETPVQSVRPDCVPPAWCEAVARAMAPVRDVSEKETGALPDACRLLDLLELEPPSAAVITARWAAGGRSTGAVVGASFDGPFTIDLVRDGPHGLVAGTTGSGKSELLQTLVASLAVANRPDAMNFVLVDYKGGAAFKGCEQLPHTVGMVTDLDSHLVKRALVSLDAEVRRRERILEPLGAKDIEAYERAARRDPSLAPLPRLLIVVDEFASMARELPDFVTGLVNIAQRGRSLGIHLILATQRPSGVVSPEIRANTNLRIALRVTDNAESQDVIDAPDSAYIAKSTPGRALVRLGASSLLPFQSGRVGGRRPQTAAEVTTQPWAVPVEWSDLGRPAPTRPKPPGGQDDDPLTDLALLVEAVRASATALGCEEPYRPWLEPLTDLVTLDEVPRPAVERRGDVPPAVFGVTDVPARQAREPLVLDLVDGDHLLLVGGPRSGRSTALRTIAGSLADLASPADVHLYGVDCGSNALVPLSVLPHCGAVVTRDQTDRLTRLLARLQAEIARRQQILARAGAANVAEQRASAATPDERLPWLVLLLDGWESYTAAFESYDYGKLTDAMAQLFREGPSVGLRVVMSAGRSGLSGVVSSSFGDRLVLRLADSNDYSTAGMTARDIPSHLPPGRALRPGDDGLLESQTALLDADPSGQAQVSAIRRIAERAAAVHGRPPRALRPMRVDALPGRATAREALALDPEFTPPSPLWALVGVGGDELGPLGVDLSQHGPGFVIAGPPKSGRSTAVCAAARSLLRAGLPLIVVTPKRSPLRELEGEPGVLGALREMADAAQLKELLDRAGADGARYAVVVDDAELVYDTPLDSVLESVVRSGVDGGHGLVAAGTTDSLTSQYRGFLREARRARSGLLLSPQNNSEGELFSIRLPRATASNVAGRGLLVLSGEMTPVQAVTDE
ncbi:FtsK/SpoIIIE domain-containing protein [Streptomyces sp. B15]|uniref:FtsK/SpoIIIE domain-containing protein n=1 Tax=Streptomyces sp. B15 TaxID=1537797 RepID=UPI001B3803F6|nr:FtsK/SpoIIIE domain-containing protein [Streptomyces sp. B15]MBQ1119271.1 cell division protein FtsK [Streptomyces sp. B15]